jgi:hypothetical protein
MISGDYPRDGRAASEDDGVPRPRRGKPKSATTSSIPMRQGATDAEATPSTFRS